jgi:RNA polymerase sigma-70 factor (ECF subfamily)
MSSNMPASADTFERVLFDTIPALKRFASHLCRDRDDADDLLQSTVVILLAHRAKFELGSHFAAWAKTIMRRAWKDECKRAETRRAIFVTLDRVRDSESEDEVEPFEGVAAENPEQAIITMQGYDAVTKLKTDVANILTETGLGCALEDIAARFALPINTVRSHIRRGRAQLVAATGGV